MRKTVIAAIAIIVTALAVYYFKKQDAVDALSLKETGWIPNWIPEPKKLASHERDSDLNTSKTVFIYEDEVLNEFLSYLERNGKEVDDSYKPKLLSQYKGRYFLAGGYLFVVNTEFKNLIILSSWREAGASRWLNPEEEN